MNKYIALFMAILAWTLTNSVGVMMVLNCYDWPLHSMMPFYICVGLNTLWTILALDIYKTMRKKL